MQPVEFVATKAVVLDLTGVLDPSGTSPAEPADGVRQRRPTFRWRQHLLGQASVYLMLLGAQLVRYGLPQPENRSH